MPIRLSLPKPKKEWRYLVPESDVPKFEKAKFVVSPHKRRGTCLVTKRVSIWEQFEQDVLILLKHGLKLADVNGGPVFRIAGYQIDAVGGLIDTLLVVECKSKREPGQRSLRSDLRLFWVKKRSVAGGLKRLFRGRYKRTKFVMVLRGITPTDNDLKYAKKKGIIVWNESYFDSIRALYFSIGERAKYYVLKELGGKPPLVPGGHGRFFDFPALATTVESEPIFALFIPVSILLDIAYVLRIESGQKKAYQRFLDKSRLVKIARFLEDGNFFKNSIVLAFPKNVKFQPRQLRSTLTTGKRAKLGLLRIPRQFASAWIIDGQHRLYGFARAEGRLHNTLLPVVALQSRSRTEEAKTFFQINKNQKPVNPDLLWALFGTLYPHEIQGMISDFVRLLASERRSILRNRIFVRGESKLSRKHYRIFHSNLCETIEDHFVEGKSKGFPLFPSGKQYDPARSGAMKHALKVINSYLSLISEFAEASEANEWIRDFFFTNNGINVMLRVLVQILKHTDGSFAKQEIRRLFERPFCDYLRARKSEIDQMRRQTSSEGTRDYAAFGFVLAFAREVKGFAEPYIKEHQKSTGEKEPYKILRILEESLRELISSRLSAVTLRWWKERTMPDIREEAEARKEQDESPWPWMEGKNYPVYYYMSFADYSKVISKRDNWREAFEAVFRDAEWVRVVFKELERIRNDIVHHRDLTDRQFTILKVYADDIARVLKGSKPNPEVHLLGEVSLVPAGD